MSQRPDMAVKVGGVELANPVLAASGTFGYGREYSPYLEPGALGGLVTKGVSLRPREGNPPPRIVETACGMLNAIGLANVGLEEFLKNKLPWLAEQPGAVVVNLYGESIEEFAELAKALGAAKGVDALELNVSCPNVKEGGMAFGCHPGAVGQVTAAAVAEAGDTPVWVKLTPNVTDLAPMAEAAAQAGARAVSLINTLMGMAIDARTRRPVLANVVGGLSGPAIKPVGLRMVWQVARAMKARHPEVDVVGLGGIMSGIDAAEYLIAGAGAVQVGTASFTEPGAAGRIAGELAEFCAQQGVARAGELTGSLHT
ncbi:MAG: dihydroorotate dehydrogenase [Desulfarculaceae bacterium]|nr:dihydroorotate dehydrogenase [Desulfarculaceae bacterium]MCF8072610.1 dihydroorotate dehydrogenase [Desulfarculaceae bacterium]MCF8103318.1 dihydroorotate dehydrogenase [Desulfarculaceae bacterium]MCF8117800.1 dihydroorotate dehydrogenase [Desulfarculaceae bacterium]